MKKTGRRQRRFNKKTLKRKYIKRQSGGNQGKMMAQTALRAMKTASRTALQNARNVAQRNTTQLKNVSVDLMEGKSSADFNFTGIRNWSKEASKPFKEIFLKKLQVSVPKTGVKMFGKKMLNFAFGLSDSERAKAFSNPRNDEAKVFTNEDLQGFASDFDTDSRRMSQIDPETLKQFITELETPESQRTLRDIANDQEELYNTEEDIMNDTGKDNYSVDAAIFGAPEAREIWPDYLSEVDGGRKRKQKTRRRKHKKSFW